MGQRGRRVGATEDRDSDRIDAGEWSKAAAPHDVPPVIPVFPIAENANPLAKVGEIDSDSDRLESCLEAAMAEAVAGNDRGRPASAGQGAGRRGDDWRAVLRQVRRDGLDEGQRTIYDELLIDALEGVGALDELQNRLARIPPEEAGPTGLAGTRSVRV